MLLRVVLAEQRPDREPLDRVAVCRMALTGYVGPEDVRRSREAGFDHHLAKPPDIAAIEKILADCAADAAAG